MKKKGYQIERKYGSKRGGVGNLRGEVLFLVILKDATSAA
jgi:hypothetical protein